MSVHGAQGAWSQALQAGTRLGQQVFGLSIEVIVEQYSRLPAVAMYEWWTDCAKIFANRVAEQAALGADPERLVTHAIAHEFGHAREARLFAESSVCPWHLSVHEDCRLETEEGFYLAKDFRREFAQITRGIEDFPIDRKLKEHGFSDEIAKARIARIQQILQHQLTDSVGKVQLRLETLFLLPSDIRYHMFGSISDQDKVRIHQFVTSVVGAETWERAVELISSREFGDIGAYERVTKAYFRDFLSLRATFESVSRETFGVLPVFWSSPTYRALCLYPAEFPSCT